ncbi:MAG: hypothetical protein HPY30_00250 [Gammaproteobacteria bacterium (ex Lamellibrachia satsuma)]|nr:MAG: hypothetical protein HPY30_00250 [Gammaproteobacteria bacterium (ex Lamellibrachia satsuma)]
MPFPIKKSVVKVLLPWGAGAGFAMGHMTLSSRCTLVLLGQCTGCAGCVIALASLVGWAALKDKGAETKTPRRT